MELVKLKLDDIVPYENNPRIIWDAVGAVKESIDQVGYISPIVVDENNVVLAGHTRLEAMYQLGSEEVECVVVSGLSDEQKRKFRILDNKLGELAEWDVDLLAGELENLDLGDVHWFDNIINPAVEELAGQAAGSSTTRETKDSEDGPIICPRCGYVLETLNIDGFEADDDETITWSNEE